MENMKSIKEYIGNANIFKEDIRQAENQEKQKQQQERSSSGKASLEKNILAANFLIEEVYRRRGVGK